MSCSPIGGGEGIWVVWDGWCWKVMEDGLEERDGLIVEKVRRVNKRTHKPIAYRATVIPNCNLQTPAQRPGSLASGGVGGESHSGTVYFRHHKHGRVKIT